MDGLFWKRPDGTPRIDPMISLPTIPDLTETAVPVLLERFHPAAVLLYGSYAKGAESDSSDVDLALLAGAETPDPFDLMTARTDLEERLGRSVDLVVLDGASPILAMEVLRHHRLLHLADREAWERFQVRVMREYFDLKLVRRPIEQALLKGRAARVPTSPSPSSPPSSAARYPRCSLSGVARTGGDRRRAGGAAQGDGRLPQHRGA